jgi:hypothetical protein
VDLVVSQAVMELVEFADIPHKDLVTSEAFVVAVKPSQKG